MPLEDHTNHKDYFEKLVNIVLNPSHATLERVAPYPWCGKREIFCGPKLKNKDTTEMILSLYNRARLLHSSVSINFPSLLKSFSEKLPLPSQKGHFLVLPQ